MKTVILAGGRGTRLSEFTSNLPKPMVEIGGKPMLWHIMKIYATFGYAEFLVALGYKSEVIRSSFVKEPEWETHLIDTGIDTQTGGRIKRLKEWIGNETFMLTYGDGVSNVDINELVAFHRKHQRLATVTAVRPPPRFGGLVVNGDRVVEFTEKNREREGWISGGFFVLEPEVIDFIQNDQTIFEREPLEQLAAKGELMAHFHKGFWQPMDNLSEYRLLESLWESGETPWIMGKTDVESTKSISDWSDGSSRIMACKVAD